MGAKSQRVAVGRRCFLWLGENVPPGKHVLTLRVDAAGERPGYVVLSRVTPGVFPRRLIQRTP
jgi:hypothetical protein